jgi:hypothetical protein
MGMGGVVRPAKVACRCLPRRRARRGGRCGREDYRALVSGGLDELVLCVEVDIMQSGCTLVLNYKVWILSSKAQYLIDKRI